MDCQNVFVIFLLTLELVQMYKNADGFEILKIQCVLVSAFIDSM